METLRLWEKSCVRDAGHRGKMITAGCQYFGRITVGFRRNLSYFFVLKSACPIGQASHNFALPVAEFHLPRAIGKRLTSFPDSTYKQ